VFAGFLLPLAMTAASADERGNPAAVPTNPGITSQTTNEVFRDPFCPVGYTPREASTPSAWTATNDVAASAAQPKVVPQWPVLKLKGVTRMAGGEYIGLLEGVGVVQPKDLIKMERDGVIYRWEVMSVGPDRVNCRPISAGPAEVSH